MESRLSRRYRFALKAGTMIDTSGVLEPAAVTILASDPALDERRSRPRGDLGGAVYGLAIKHRRFPCNPLVAEALQRVLPQLQRDELRPPFQDLLNRVGQCVGILWRYQGADPVGHDVLRAA